MTNPVLIIGAGPTSLGSDRASIGQFEVKQKVSPWSCPRFTSIDLVPEQLKQTTRALACLSFRSIVW